MNFQTIFVIASMLMFFLVLTRESIIDLKIEYVPNNIIMESYFTSILFLVSFCIIQFVNKEELGIENPWSPLINGIITFLVVFFATFMIAFVAWIKAKLAVKKKNKQKEKILKAEQKNKETINEEIEIELDISKDKKTKDKKELSQNMKFLLLSLYSFGITTFVGILQKVYPWYIVTFSLLFILLLSFGIYWKTKKIDYSVYTISIGLIILFCFKRYFSESSISIFTLLLAVLCACVGEFIIYKLFKRFYENGGQAIDENGFLLPADQQPVPENETEEDKEVTFAIGGGDMILFGAIGLLVGLEGLLTIFVNAAFVFFAMLFGFMIIKRENIRLLPFVPAITIGYIMYFCNFNVINLTALITNYMNM